MKGTVIEMAPFTLAKGVTEKRLLEASSILQDEFLQKQPGFIKRELLKESETRWVDIVYWSSHDKAQEAMKRATSSHACSLYFQLMEMEEHHNPGNGVKLYERVSEY